MKKYILFLLLCLNCIQTFSQNIPTVGAISINKVQKNTFDNYLIVSNITDGELLLNQPLTLTGFSSNNEILSVTGIEHTLGQPFAIIKVKEFGITGTVNINFSVSDIDGSTSQNFNLSIGNFYTKGCKWSIYDIPFAYEFVPSPNVKSHLDSTNLIYHL